MQTRRIVGFAGAVKETSVAIDSQLITPTTALVLPSKPGPIKRNKVDKYWDLSDEQRAEIDKALGYDLRAALYHNSLGEHLAQISNTLLELYGENDGRDWHWIVQLKDGTYAYVCGGCDYTGWDCQSNCSWYPAGSLQEALRLVGQDKRRVFNEMLLVGDSVRPNTGGL